MAQIVTAQFVGQTSCGFVSKKYYEIEISAGRSGCLCVRDVQGQGFCPYSTLAALRRNWKIIDNEKTPGGEPGRNEAGCPGGEPGRRGVFILGLLSGAQFTDQAPGGRRIRHFVLAGAAMLCCGATSGNRLL